MPVSNPFLALSRQWQKPYGDVLCFAAAYKKKFDSGKMDFWEKKAAKNLQGTSVGKAIIDLCNGVELTVIYSLHIANNSNFLEAPIPMSGITCIRSGKTWTLTKARFLFDRRENDTHCVANVTICWNEAKELVFQCTNDAIKYAARLVDEEGNVDVIGDPSLLMPMYEEQLDAAAFRDMVKTLLPDATFCRLEDKEE